MKKYLKLTSNEAIRHFILKDKTLVPESSEELIYKYNDLENLKSEISVSITIPTHRTRPDSEIDPILLKNKIMETENILLKIVDKRKMEEIMENIKEAQGMIDFSLNLDSLVLYTNEYFSSVVKLPVELKEELVIGQEFDLRPLYKTRQQNRRFYILAISRNVIRLMEAFNDKITQEIQNEDFPYINDYYVDEPAELAQDSFIDNQVKEYFNTADKRFQKYYNENPLPVILAGDIKTTSYYAEQMDRSCMVIGHVSGNFDRMPCHEIISVVQPEVEAYRKKKEEEYLSQIDAALSANLLVTDMSDIERAIEEGAAGVFIAGNNYFPDIMTYLMKQIRDQGGDIIFVDDELMDKFDGKALIRRY